LQNAHVTIGFLIGRWDIRRRVLDLGRGVEGAFEGVAVIEPDEDGLRWRERGRLRLGAYDGVAVREYRIAPRADGWMVEFADGRPFHPLAFGGPVEHVCGEDRYAGEYAVRGPDAFDVVWLVRGPHKHQRIESAYRRA
jgi:hypothetical protein